MKTTTTKTSKMWIFGALALGVLLVMVPNSRSDDATDWANQQVQAQKEREQAERDRQERENWQNQIAQAQKEREDWYNQQAQAQKEREDWQNQQAQAQREAEQAQKERDLNDYLNKISQNDQNLMNWAVEQARARQKAINQGEWGSPAARPAALPSNPRAAGPGAAPKLAELPPPRPEAKQLKTYTLTINDGIHATRTTFVMRDDGSWHAVEDLGIDTVSPAAQVTASPPAGALITPQVRFPAQSLPQQDPRSFDPVAFQQQVRQNQEWVRQQILQSREQMMQRIRR
jgi:hypothetical protein